MGRNGNGGFIQELGKFYIIRAQLTAAAGASVSTTPAEQVGPFPFRWEELGAVWDDTKGDWRVKITDNGENETFMGEQVKVAGLIGSSDKAPYRLRKPHVFGGGSAIMVEATNDGSDADTLELLFIGTRLPART